MIRASVILVLAALAQPLWAQQDTPHFAVPAAQSSPVPAELSADPTLFHATAVGLDGRLNLSFTDLSVTARGWPLTFFRSYAAGASGSSLGPNWVSTIDVTLARSRDTGTIFVSEATGGESAYQRMGNGVFEGVSGRIDARIVEGPGRLQRIFSDGSRELFSPDGLLLRRVGSDGFGYSLERDDMGRVRELRHQDGQRLEFSWDGNRLVAVRDAIGRGIDFEYDAGVLIRSRDVLGRLSGYAYDSVGRLSDVIFADQSTLSVEYDVNNRVRRMVGPGTLATSFDHWGAIEENRLVQTQTGATGLKYRSELILSPDDENWFSLEMTDPAGEVTVHDQRGAQVDVSRNGVWLGAVIHDAAGLPDAVIRPDGMALISGVDAEGSVPFDAPDEKGRAQLVLDDMGRGTWREYDAVGRVTTRAGREGIPEVFEYDLGNRLIRYVSFDGVTYDYRYDDSDRMLAWSGSDGSAGAYAYNGLGQVLRISETGSADQTFSYDAAGRITALNNGERDYLAEYDASGRATGLWSSDGRGFGFRYDDAGRFEGFVDESALEVTFATDGSQVFSDNTGRIRGLVENEDGSLIILEPGGSRTFIEALEGNDQLVTLVDQNGKGRIERRDANGALLASESLGGAPFVFETDADGMPSVIGDPLLPSTLEFDDRDLLARTVDGIGVVSEFEHDEFGRLARVSSPYHALEFLFEGADGAPSGFVSSDGFEVTQEYDDRGRLIRSEYRDELGVTSFEALEWSDDDLLVSRTDGLITERFDYPDENTTIYTQEIGDRILTWKENLDPVARTLTTTLPDGTTSTATMNEAGYIVGVESAINSAALEVGPDGELLSATNGGLRQGFGANTLEMVVESTEDVEGDDRGVVKIEKLRHWRGGIWTIGYDYRGYPLTVTNPLKENTFIEYDAAGRVSLITDSEGRVFYALYDDLGRETESGVVGGWAKATEWDRNTPVAVSDSAGNRSYVDVIGEGLIAGYTNGSEDSRFSVDASGYLTRAGNAVGEVSFYFNDIGELASERDVFGRELTYRYDALGRLSEIVLPGGDVIRQEWSAGNTLTQTGPDGQQMTTRWTPDRAGYDLTMAGGVTARLDVDVNDAPKRIEINGQQTRVLEIDRLENGDVGAIREDGAETRFRYDLLGRLVGVSEVENAETEWTYDGSDNILRQGDGQTRSYDEAFRLTDFEGAAPDYDDAGRMTSLGGLDLSYDASGRLTKAGAFEFRYDAIGRLVERIGPDRREQYLYRGNLLLAVYDGNTGGRLALIERNAVMPQLVRLHRNEGVDTLLPDHLGTPRISVSGNDVSWLDSYGPWGDMPRDAPDFARWIGFTGHMQVPDAGLVLMPDRAYMPALQRFTTPDPLGLANPVNPYAYANLNPATMVDVLGANASLPNISPDKLTHRVLPLGYLKDPIVDGGPPGRARRAMNDLVAELKAIHNNARNTPAARRVAMETLLVLKNKGVSTTFDPHMGEGHLGASRTYGGGRGSLDINPYEATKLNPKNPARGFARIAAHETGHIIQGVTQDLKGRPVGRALRETLSMLREDVLARAHGAEPPKLSVRKSLRESFDYALRTQHRAYVTEQKYGLGAKARRIPTKFGRFAGMRQLSPDMVVKAVQHYHPQLRPHEILEDFVAVHKEVVNSPDDLSKAIREHLKSEPELKKLIKDQIRHARSIQRGATPESIRSGSGAGRGPATGRPGEKVASRASSASTRRLPRATPQTSKPVGDPPKATSRPNHAARPNAPDTPSRAGRPTRTARPTTQAPVQPRSTAPRTASADAPTRASVKRPATQGAPTRRLATRPPTQRLTSIPHVTSSSQPVRGAAGSRSIPVDAERPPQRSRPPATQANPHPRNTRPATSPRAGRPRPAATAPEPPRVRRTPPTPAADAPRLPSRAARATRPPIDAPHPPRPSARGGRYQVPDLRTTQIVDPPPRVLRNGGSPSSTAPHRPRGHTGGLMSHPKVRVALKSGFVLLDGAMMIYDSYEYLEGRRTTREYVTSMALNTAMMVLPHPISTAIMAHQMGSFLGSYLASKLLEDYYNGDPVARALINWMRRSGWINANDPTFVAVSETAPPSMTDPGLLVLQGSDTAIPVSFWAQESAQVDLFIEQSDGSRYGSATPISARPGLNRAVLTEPLVASLPAGQYRVTLSASGRSDEPVLTFEVLPPSEAEPVLQPASGQTEPLEIEIRETRLDPTNLPWNRFDRPETLLRPQQADDVEYLGAWSWSSDDTMGWNTHRRDAGRGPIHYALFQTGTQMLRGENIIQYVWIDPDDPPDQIVLQIYDEALSAHHRVTFGADSLAIEGRDGVGLVHSGGLPPVGTWVRLRVPAEDIGMDGHRVAGIGFISNTGRVLWGPTRFGGAEDTSPMMSELGDRDTSGAPQSDMLLRLTTTEPAETSIALITRDGSRIDLFEGHLVPGRRQFWWNGDSELLRGAEVRIAHRDADGDGDGDGDGDNVETGYPVDGNPGLVARILYPPYGAVVRQTVPVFGQAGGVGFDRFVVEYRASGSGEDAWQPLASSNTPSLVTDAGIRDRIDRIMASELRGTVYGNLASLQTGSALHSFEFSEAAPVLPSGWIDIRLTTYDAEGDTRQDVTSVIVGEVATGQVRSDIASLDGRAVLSIPPLSLPAGMGALSLAVTDRDIPAGAPEPIGAAYEFVPSGLQISSAPKLAIQSPNARTIVAVQKNGRVEPLATQVENGIVKASVNRLDPGAIYYATAQEFTSAPTFTAPINAPWFTSEDGNGDAGLIASHAGADAAGLGLSDPVPIDRPLALMMSLTPLDIAKVGLVLRFDGEARFVPLSAAPAGLDPHLAAEGLGLANSEERTAVFLPLVPYLPDNAQKLEAVELMSIEAAAWRSYVGRQAQPDEVILHTMALGVLPSSGSVTAWASPAPWTAEAGAQAPSTDPIHFETDGIHWVQIDGTDEIWPVLFDSAPPVIFDPQPAPDEESRELTVRATLTDAGSGIAAQSVSLSINGIPVPRHLLHFDPVSGQLQASIGDLAEARIRNGSVVSATLTVADKPGQQSQVTTWEWRHRSEAVAVGNLTQLTVDGGSEPAWEPGNSNLVYVGLQDGQRDLFRVPATGGSPERLTNTASTETDPAISENGSLAYLVDGTLYVNGNALVPGFDGLNGLSWLDSSTLVSGQNNRLVRIGLDGTIETLCEIAAGAEVHDPKVLGDEVLFVQQLYHRTIWICDPRSRLARPLSVGINKASTRDIDPGAMGENRFIFARNDGNAGLWQRGIDDPRSIQVLAPAGGSDRNPAISTDGNVLLFDSDRGGRREIWRMDFSTAPDIEILTRVVRGDLDNGLELRAQRPGQNQSLTITRADGEVVDSAPRIDDTENGLRVLASEVWPEGELQVTLTLENGSSISMPFVVDRTPPDLRVTRISDGRDLFDIATVSPLDRFRIDADDQSDVTFGGDLTDGIVADQPFSAADLATPVLEISAHDGAGNIRIVQADLTVGETAQPRFVRDLSRTKPVSDDRAEPDPYAADQKATGTPVADYLWAVLALAFLILAAAILVLRRRAA